MSNPFIINVPTLISNPNPPIQIVSNPPPLLIKNLSISQTSLNNNSTYFSNNYVNAVTSVNTLQNAVTISSTNPNLTVAEVGNDIQLTVLAGGIGVETLNTLDGNVTLSSTNQNLTIAQNGNDIQLTVLAGGIGVESLNTLAGNITMTSTDQATLTIAQVGNNIQLTVPPVVGGVESLNTLTGNIDFTSTGGTVAITNNGQNINFEALGITPVSDWANFPAINTVNIPDHDLNMTTTTPGLAYNKATLNADVDIGTLTNAPLRPDFNAYCGTVTFGGVASPLTGMSINSLGAVAVTSALGVSIAGGGGVGITGGGAVTVNGVGGILIDGGGAISINGVGGISIVGSGALGIASGGILVSGGGIAINAGGVSINAGGLSVLAGVTAIGSGGLSGGGLNVYGSDLSLIPVGANTSTLRTNLITSTSGTPTLAISNVATINGIPFPFRASYDFYVAPNGNDTTGNGSEQNPFLTIERAITARATIANTFEVSIHLASGTYSPVGGNITLLQNTFLIGIPSGETNQPVNINSQIYLQGGATGQVALYGLNLFQASSQCIVCNGVGTYNVNACNIVNLNNYSVFMSLGTLFLTECRITCPTLTSQPFSGVGGTGGTLIMRDCLLNSAGVNSMVQFSGSLTIRQCNLINTNTSANVSPLVLFNPTVSGTTCEISYSTLQYTSPNNASNKICVRTTVGAGINAVLNNFVNNLLICEGATSGTSPNNYHCIDKTGAGTATLSYGNLLAGATAHQIDTTITKTQFNTVP